MFRNNIWFAQLLVVSLSLSACAQKESEVVQEEVKPETAVVSNPEHKKQHPYGGWYCPDNFGFPPVDIQDMSAVPVVNGRMPTKEETMNGTSLMYFDPAEMPDAKPLEIELPKVAKIYSEHSEMEELIIVIQAVEHNNDTVIGFRYANGGNGTSWYSDVTFLTDAQVSAVGPSPFVFIETDIQGGREQIWNAIRKTAYAQELGILFNQQAFFESEWTSESSVNLNMENEDMKASGVITALWGNLYLHIDYDYNGFHISEKMLLMQNAGENTAKLIVASGPHPADIESQKDHWNKWIQGVSTVSE